MFQILFVLSLADMYLAPSLLAIIFVHFFNISQAEFCIFGILNEFCSTKSGADVSLTHYGYKLK